MAKMNFDPIVCTIITDRDEKIEFPVASFHHDVSNERSPVGEQRANLPHHGAVSLVKDQDDATIPLYETCLDGIKLTTVEINWLRVGDNGKEIYFTHTFENGVLSSISTDASSGGKAEVMPVEQLVIVYQKAVWLQVAGNRTCEQDWYTLLKDGE